MYTKCVLVILQEERIEKEKLRQKMLETKKKILEGPELIDDLDLDAEFPPTSSENGVKLKKFDIGPEFDEEETFELFTCWAFLQVLRSQ